MTAEASTQQRRLPQLLSTQLNTMRRVQTVPKTSSLPHLAPGDLLDIRKRCESLGQPWTLKHPVRDQVTQTSYRVYPALLSQVRASQHPGDVTSNYDLQITLALVYLALPALRTRVNSRLRLRCHASAQDRSARQHPDAAPVAAVLVENDLPWRGRTTLRRATTQVAMRVTTALADALKAAPPTDLRCTIADLHTTLLALYLTDAELRAQIGALLAIRRKA